jgi:hypothetical protein
MSGQLKKNLIDLGAVERSPCGGANISQYKKGSNNGSQTRY